MKRFVAALGIAVIFGTSAMAADMAPRTYAKAPPVAAPVNNWAGFYLGANGGYAWSVDDSLLSYNNVGVFNGVAPKGGFGGGQLGYNWQFNSVVVGLETDIEGSNITDSGISTGGRSQFYKLNWFGTVRGRLGFAVQDALFYATGGFAYGGLNKYTTGGVPTDFTYNSTATGYVAGAGLEYKFTPSWSVKAEYQYINLRRNDLYDPTGVNFATTRNLNTADDAFHTVRVGVNYFFGGPVVAKY
ncbi:porin family protein [Bradyrhizobium guangdongense]|uniref:outer membrane protein n=1 Tax=Bradyrhizobium guangdongense TaxID=1325090 RepID=UPI001127FE3A|nr:outer membrane protein [Bradyrhizobium guangdongense]TPQ40288.1 porin family protein [Bradyrhizobium guangdongense]